ncbi:MAG: hypothetical protein V7746_10620 [Halioglobus sp.]
MSEHDNELLSQYLDGELGAPQTLELKKRLLAEPQLRASLEQLQQVDNALRNAFDTPAAEQVPAAVTQMIQPANTKAQPQRKAAWGFAIAASIMASSGLLLFQGNQLAVDDSSVDTQFVQALENNPSRSEGWDQLADGRQLRAILSFPSTDNGWCREYLLADGEQTAHGIACRGEGQWTTLAVTFQTLSLDTASSYRPAGANNPDVIANFAEHQASGIALSAEAEAELQANDWQ